MKALSIVLGIIYIILGVICMAIPMSVGTTFLYIIGFAVFIGGIWLIVSYFTKNKIFRNGWSLFYGIITTILAIIILFNPYLSELTIAIILNIWIVTIAIQRIIHSVKLRKVKSSWVLSLILAIVFLIAGIFLMLHPYFSFLAYKFIFGIYFGVTLIIDGINFIAIGLLLDK